MLTPEVQQKLISETINSAICIDNEYVEAYTDGGDGRMDESRQLYESFRDSGLCHPTPNPESPNPDYEEASPCSGGRLQY